MNKLILWFGHLRQINKVKQFLNFSDTQIINALIFSHLDYCNSLYYGIKKSTLDQLQLVQNVAAKLLTRTRKYECIYTHTYIKSLVIMLLLLYM